MIIKFRSNRFVWGGFVLFLCVASLTGCSSLRKKFTRTPKGKVADTFIPVLEPVKYQKVEEAPEQKYAQHYSMVKVYFKDLWEVLGQRDSRDKREKYVFTELLSHFDAMAALLNGVRQEEARTMRVRVDNVLKEYDKISSMRRYDLILSDMHKIERDLLKAFKPAVVAGSFAAGK